MKLTNVTAIVTGANRGMGAILVRDLLAGGARKVYAGARSVDSLVDVVALDPSRVVPLRLDITNADDVALAVQAAGDITMLVNNAGYAARGSALNADFDDAAASMDVNYFGTLRTIRGFVPVLEQNGGGAIVTILSMLSLAPISGVATYSASKAALESVTQSMRSDLASRGIDTHAVYPALVDTEMAKGIELPKADPESVVAAVLAGVEAGDGVIIPDEMSTGGYATWVDDPRALRDFMSSL